MWRLVALDAGSLEHSSQCPALDDGLSGAMSPTMAPPIVRLDFNPQGLWGLRRARRLGNAQRPLAHYHGLLPTALSVSSAAAYSHFAGTA